MRVVDPWRAAVVADNVVRQLLQFCCETGFDEVAEEERWPTMFGALGFIRAVSAETDRPERKLFWPEELPDLTERKRGGYGARNRVGCQG